MEDREEKRRVAAGHSLDDLCWFQDEGYEEVLRSPVNDDLMLLKGRSVR